MSLEDLLLNQTTQPTPSEIDRARYPEIVISSGYLDDPIQFSSDSRFTPHTAVSQLKDLSTLNKQLSRDFAEFLEIDKNNNDEQLLIVNMFSKTVNRTSFDQIVMSKAAFTQFGI